MGLIDMSEYSITDLTEESDFEIKLLNSEAKNNLEWFISEVDELLEIFSGITGITADVENKGGKLIFSIDRNEVITCSKFINSINMDLVESRLSSLIGVDELKLLIKDVIEFFCMVITKNSKGLAENAMEQYAKHKVNDWDYCVNGFDMVSWSKDGHFVVFIDKTI